MNKRSLGVKLVGGFVLVAVVVLLVGMVGWNGIQKTSTSLDAIARVRVPGIRSLTTMKEAATAIRAAQRSLLNPDLGKEGVEIQYATIAEEKEKYGKAWSAYEALPKTDEEKRLWTELVPAWEAWQSDSEEFLRLSKTLTAMDILNPVKLRQTLERIKGHHCWLAGKVGNMLQTEAEFEGGDQAGQSPLALWVSGFQTVNPGIKDVLQRIPEPHENLYASVAEIKEYIRKGEIDGASFVYEAKMMPAMETLSEHFEGLMGISVQAEELYNQMNRQAMVNCLETEEKAFSVLNRLVRLNAETATTRAENALQESENVAWMAIWGIVAGFLAALGLGIVLTRSITGRLGKVVRMAEAIRRGDLSSRLGMKQRDEIGRLAHAFDNMADTLERKARLAHDIAQGDLMREVELASEKDILGKAFLAMKENLDDTLGKVREAGDGVSRGASYISEACLHLSRGAAQSAASLEEIASSMSQVDSQAGVNADNAKQASQLTERTYQGVEQGSSQMSSMMEAMNEIQASSKEIVNIIKVINDIAFQTNLLALNAAVEAARAGHHGKGFAVVAEEVRNLAVRSGEAARETTEKIEASMNKIEKGARTATQAIETFSRISEELSRVNDLMGEIASASGEQTQAIGQITRGLDQIEEVTQQNAASAESITEASEELSSRASQLRELLSHFRLAEQRTAIPEGAPTTESSVPHGLRLPGPAEEALGDRQGARHERSDHLPG